MLSQALTRVGFCFVGILVFGVGPSTVRADISAGQFLVDVWKPDEGVPNNSVTGFAQGTDGYLWMISDKALARFDGNRFVEVPAEKFAPAPVERAGPLLRYAGRLFDGPSGSVWLTTTAGDLWRWQGREFQPWFPKKTTNRAFVRIFELPGNEVLALSSSGSLFRGNQTGIREIADCAAQGHPLPDTVSRDVDGRIWFLTERAKVVRMDPEGHTESPSSCEVEGKPFALTSDPFQRIWLGTDHGLFEWRGDHFEQFPLPGPDQGSPVQNILPGHDDRLWVSWQGQAWLLHEGKWKGPVAEWPNDVHPRARLVDRAGRLWLAPPHRGVWCLQPEEQTLRLGPEQGLSADATALFCDREGDVWISIYRTGVARICRPDHIAPNAVRPPVVIEEVMIDGQPWSPPRLPANQSTPEALGLSALAIKVPARLELSPGPHALEIHYTAASLAAAEKVRFEYKIEGLDQNWLKADSRRSAFCSFLPPGQYHFRVRACNNDGLWNETGAELAIAVQPYFWQTRWFPGLMAFTFAAMSGGAVALRQRSRHRHQLVRLEFQHAKEVERTRISRDLHDHLGASLTAIGMLAADGADSAHAPEPTRCHCHAIMQKVDSAISELDALVWAVDPRHDTLASLPSYLGSFVEEYALACSLDCRVDIQRELPGWVLASDARQSLLLAVTEAVHNAVRHARATEIALRLAVIERRLEITISDNGCGFNPSLATSGNGLTNLQERLASLRGSCEIGSQPGAGTTVTLVCPRLEAHSL